MPVSKGGRPAAALGTGRRKEAVARVHGEVFAEIRPANTLVQAALVGDEYLVEVEAEAVIG